MIRILIAILAVVNCVSCASSSTSTPSQAVGLNAVDYSANYLLYPGDRVDIQVFGEPDLSGEYTVDTDGSINFPLVGRAQAAGKTISFLENHLSTLLRGGYLVEPKVRVQVLSYRPIYIQGEVKNQGEYPFSPGLTVQQLVTLAGGLTPFAAEKYYLQRNGSSPSDRYRVMPETRVFPGDLVFVGERIF